MLKTQSINLDYIRTFVVVSQSKDFREAATKLNIDHTNVSRHIKNLEETMETKLINRDSNNLIELTEDGKKLIDGWTKAYNLILLTEKNFIQEKSLDSGKISIGISEDIENDLLNDKVKAFKKKYPNVIFKIVNSNTKELFGELANYYLDFVIDERYDEIKKTSDIKSKTIYTVEYCIAYSSKYFDVCIKNLCDLENKPLILPISTKLERVRFEKLLSESNIKKDLSIEVTNYQTSLDYANAGLGLALVPKKAIENTELKYLDIDLDKEISISYANGNLSPSDKEFLKLFE